MRRWILRSVSPVSSSQSTYSIEADIVVHVGRRRALDRAMDAALKNPTKRRRRAGEIVYLVYLLSPLKRH